MKSSDPIVVEALARLAEEEKLPPAPSFSHTVVEAPILQVARQMVEHFREKPRNLESALRSISIPAPNRAYYLAPLEESRTIVWHEGDDRFVIVDLSKKLQCSCHWISVFEEFKSRAYIRASSGKIDQMVLDPETPLRTNAWSGADLSGASVRRFDSVTSFLDEISPHYRPVDTAWTFAEWDDRNTRQELLRDASLKFSLKLKVSCHSRTEIDMSMKFIGSWIADLRKSLKLLLTEN